MCKGQNKSGPVLLKLVRAGNGPHFSQWCKLSSTFSPRSKCILAKLAQWLLYLLIFTPAWRWRRIFCRRREVCLGLGVTCSRATRSRDIKTRWKTVNDIRRTGVWGETDETQTECQQQQSHLHCFAICDFQSGGKKRQFFQSYILPLRIS